MAPVEKEEEEEEELLVLPDRESGVLPLLPRAVSAKMFSMKSATRLRSRPHAPLPLPLPLKLPPELRRPPLLFPELPSPLPLWFRPPPSTLQANKETQFE
jgi:hypothetical protein